MVQWALLVMGPLMYLKSVAQDQGKWKAINENRKTIRDHFDEAAHGQRTSLLDAGEQYLSEWIAEVEQSLSGLTKQGAEISAERATALEGIKSLRGEAEKLVRSAADRPGGPVSRR